MLKEGGTKSSRRSGLRCMHLRTLNHEVDDMGKECGGYVHYFKAAVNSTGNAGTHIRRGYYVLKTLKPFGGKTMF